MNTTKENREYLLNVTFPHVEAMPTTYEEAVNQHIHAEHPAIFDLGCYISMHSPLNADKITSEYDCGRHGCLAGWYVMLSDRDKRFDEQSTERYAISDFSISDLAAHFGIEEIEASNLFESRGSGAEDHECMDTEEALAARKTYLIKLMETEDGVSTVVNLETPV